MQYVPLEEFATVGMLHVTMAKYALEEFATVGMLHVTMAKYATAEIAVCIWNWATLIYLLIQKCYFCENYNFGNIKVLLLQLKRQDKVKNYYAT